jgi:hypothetical protein
MVAEAAIMVAEAVCEASTAEVTPMGSSEAPDVPHAHSAEMTSTKSTHVTPTESTHVTPAEATSEAAHVTTTTEAAAASFCAGYYGTASERSAEQHDNHPFGHWKSPFLLGCFPKHDCRQSIHGASFVERSTVVAAIVARLLVASTQKGRAQH